MIVFGFGDVLHMIGTVLSALIKVYVNNKFVERSVYNSYFDYLSQKHPDIFGFVLSFCVHIKNNLITN